MTAPRIHAPGHSAPGVRSLKRAITSTRGHRLRFRDELLHAQGLEAVWPDGSHGRIEAVVVAPYDFWPEALIVVRDGEPVRVPAVQAGAIEPARVVLGVQPTHRIGPPSTMNERRNMR